MGPQGTEYRLTGLPIIPGIYRISSFKRRGVYLLLRLLGAAFISKIRIEENEIMCQLKTIRYFLSHVM